MKKKIKQTLAFFLALSIAVTSFTQVYADGEAVKPIAGTEKAAEENDFEAVSDVEQPERTPITDDNLPEKVKHDGFKYRLKSEEKSLSEIVLEKDDGTRALYLFDTNIKFKDKNGKIKDKSNKVQLNNQNGSRFFKSEANDIDVTLPMTAESGITVKDDGVNITMRPIIKGNAGKAQSVGKISEEEGVVYHDVFDAATDLKYTYTYDGVKEDIILEKYNGKNSFDFEVTTGGLTLTEEKGTLLLKDENGEVKATLGDVIVFSADNKNNTLGDFIITEKEKNNVYTVTVSVDKKYLTDPDTVYPVTIDPTVKTIDSYSCSIQDLQVFKGTDGSGSKETSEGFSSFSRVGWTDWGACRTLMKLNGLYFSDRGIVDPSQITSAYVEMRDLMCQGGAEVPITCVQFMGNIWSESDTKTWNALGVDYSIKTSLPVGVSNGKGNSTRELPDKDQRYDWNILPIVRQWVTNSSYYSKGLEFKTFTGFLESSSSYAGSMKTFGSYQGDIRYKPYFCIEYSETVPVKDISISKTDLTLDVGKTAQLTATITPSTASNKGVTWKSSNTSVATVSSSGKVMAYSSGDAVITATSKANSSIVAKCSVRVRLTPEEQDKEVMSYHDYITVVAIKEYMLYTHNIPEFANIKKLSYLAIREIRNQDKYKWKYEMSDSTGCSRDSYGNISIPEDAKYSLSVTSKTVNILSAPETVGNWGLFLFSEVAPNPILKTLLSLTSVAAFYDENEDKPLDLLMSVMIAIGGDMPTSFYSTMLTQEKIDKKRLEKKYVSPGDYEVVVAYHPDYMSSTCIVGDFFFDNDINKYVAKLPKIYKFLGSSSALGRFFEDSSKVSVSINN